MVVEVNGYTIEPGANLKDADLSRADLTDADLDSVNLEGARLRSAKIDYGERRIKKSDTVGNSRWRYDEVTGQHVHYSRWDTDDFGRTVETSEFGVQRRIDD